jgi:predicted transporter
MTVAWLPAGVAAGIALGALTRLPRIARALVAGLGSFALLVLGSAVSDSIAQNDGMREHISGAFSRGAIWFAVALVVAGVLIAPPWASRPDPEAAASPS